VRRPILGRCCRLTDGRTPIGVGDDPVGGREAGLMAETLRKWPRRDEVVWRYAVSLAKLKRWPKQWRETGDLVAKRSPGQAGVKIGAYFSDPSGCQQVPTDRHGAGDDEAERHPDDQEERLTSVIADGLVVHDGTSHG
jgi:hypothetical protein